MCAQAALGGLKTTLDFYLFISHELNLKDPRLSLKIKNLSFINKTLTKPQYHPP